MTEQNHAGRSQSRDLAAKLGSDGAAGAGNEHRLPGRQLGDGSQVCLNRLAAQEVLNFNLTQSFTPQPTNTCRSWKAT